MRILLFLFLTLTAFTVKGQIREVYHLNDPNQFKFDSRAVYLPAGEFLIEFETEIYLDSVLVDQNAKIQLFSFIEGSFIEIDQFPNIRTCQVQYICRRLQYLKIKHSNPNPLNILLCTSK